MADAEDLLRCIPQQHLQPGSIAPSRLETILQSGRCLRQHMNVASRYGDLNLTSGVTSDVLASLRITSCQAYAVPGPVRTFGPRDIEARSSVSPENGKVIVY